MFWRAYPPMMVDVGPVLSRDDAVASKLSALYSRGEPRDFLDVYSIRISGKYTDEVLLDLVRNFDPSFETHHFAQRLQHVHVIAFEQVRIYDVDRNTWDQICTSLACWGESLIRRKTQ